MKTFKKKNIIPLFISAILFGFVSCGDGSSSSSNGNGNGESNEDPTEEPGETQRREYVADLQGLNTDIAGDISGEMTFIIEDGEFIAEADIANSPPNTVHSQHIHVSDNCPTMEDQDNEDGILDVVEALQASGDILVPLDSDLSARSAGQYPSSGSNGNYFYSESANFDELVSDLREGNDAEEGEEAMYAQLEENESLNLENRVVIVHGIPSDTVLIATVRGAHGLSAQETLPIACGEIRRVED